MSLRRRLLTLVGALGLATAGCAGKELVDSPPANQRADFALRDTSGRLVRLSDYLGRDVVLLNFWATWCAPCVAEMPHLNRLFARHKADGLMVLGISMDGPETVADVSSFTRRYGLSFPVLLDEETRVVGIYNPKRAAPFNVLIGRNGAIAKVREGYVVGDETIIESEVVALLEEARRPQR
jgi:peroxiredoxin